MRGEYRARGSVGPVAQELPPRARRIPGVWPTSLTPPGTTSACAENTATHRGTAQASGNYLRVRGEYYQMLQPHYWPRELPPRARRIPPPAAAAPPSSGTTSACAENTFGKENENVNRWNYLRVRGEYPPFFLRAKFEKELPPRARRIRMEALNNIPPHGTTSACAENTHLLTANQATNWNYLRVRGEYPK